MAQILGPSSGRLPSRCCLHKFPDVLAKLQVLAFGVGDPLVVMLGITDMNALEQADMTIFDSADLDRDAAMSIIAEHTRFGRGTSSIS